VLDMMMAIVAGCSLGTVVGKEVVVGLVVCAARHAR